MIIKGLEMPTEEITLTIAPNGWVYKVISKGCAVLLDGVTAENEKKVLYLCDRSDKCSFCSAHESFGCHATTNVEHAIGFVKNVFGDYMDERIEEETR